MRSKEVESTIKFFENQLKEFEERMGTKVTTEYNLNTEILLNYISNLEKENTDAKEYADDVWRKQEELRNIIEEVKEFITNHTPSDIGICGNSKKYYYTLGEDSVDKILELLEGE